MPHDSTCQVLVHTFLKFDSTGLCCTTDVYNYCRALFRGSRLVAPLICVNIMLVQGAALAHLQDQGRAEVRCCSVDASRVQAMWHSIILCSV